MPSLLSTGTKRRAPPAWCKAGKWGLIPPLIAGKPVRLVVFARWKQDHCAVNVDLIESFQLSYDAVTKDWSGASTNEGPNLAIEVATLAEKDHYDVELMLRNNKTIIDSHTWTNQTIPDVRPFDTGRLDHVIIERKWFYQLHAKG